MPALFPRRATPLARAALTAACAAVIAVPSLVMAWVRTPWARGEHRSIVQPVPFDHRVHVVGQHIDCRYCHFGADQSAMAGLPSTQQCVGCHKTLWLSTATLAPIRQSVATGKPIPWRRVTQLPDFVYFNHSIHVNKGVGCETCHGRIDEMAQVSQVAPLTMKWCLECHRDPAPNLRPVEAITVQGYSPHGDARASGAILAARYHVRSLTNCSTCHR